MKICTAEELNEMSIEEVVKYHDKLHKAHAKVQE